MPVEDPPTSTAIPLRPSAAARTTEPSSASWSRGTYAGSAGSPGCESSGCTGRCTSSANGSLTSSSGHPATGPASGRCSTATSAIPSSSTARSSVRATHTVPAIHPSALLYRPDTTPATAPSLSQITGAPLIPRTTALEVIQPSGTSSRVVPPAHSPGAGRNRYT